jgi:hypothetical protein
MPFRPAKSTMWPKDVDQFVSELVGQPEIIDFGRLGGPGGPPRPPKSTISGLLEIQTKMKNVAEQRRALVMQRAGHGPGYSRLRCVAWTRGPGYTRHRGIRGFS